MENIAPSPKLSNPVSTPLLISMIGIASTTLAIVLYHLIVVRYCIRAQRTAAASPRHPSATTGVDEKILETVPILAYSAQNHDLFRVDQNECAVCLVELEEREMVRLLPNCRHAFHVPCVDQWLMGHTTCPICRSPIVVEVIPDVVDQENDGPHHPIQQSHDLENDGTGGERLLLRPCASFMLPTERSPGRLVAGLKRSLSMDQSFLVINMERESKMVGSSPSSSPSSSSNKVDVTRSNRDRSGGHLSSKLRSLSWLKIGRGGTSNGVLLPY
ncbi:RING-H2 finger protein [Actinidia chinensis var. chinensis]|uniref:RING-type E3 ubiquitin transferase n=1 Tax=Actinidia chinensis var. chinensis TaxID=1590841 RepID=A0A2R6RS60_ACTCC|nr:RING-H2 finger protein [Actinidia chinensis var. chinensis]